MKKRQRFRWIAAAALPLLMTACGNRVASGPPAIRYGQDVCSECGMIVSDERFASAIVPEASEQGPLLFDDVGCMLDYEQAHQVGKAARYFHDVRTRQWITAEEASFVKTGQQTPMGSGLQALGDRAAAQKLAEGEKTSGGRVRAYSELRQAAPAAPEGH